MKRYLIPVALALVVLALPGSARAQYAILDTQFSGLEETPPNDSSARGFAVFVINLAQTRIHYQIRFRNLTAEATASQIQFGPPGMAGPIIFSIPDTPSTTDGLYGGYLTEADFIPNADLPTFADAIQAMVNGLTYFNMDDDNYPDGEVRGQIALY
jgi:hypothetical protein